jgi:hypothetical protein
MEDRFRRVEKKFLSLKEDFRQGRISQREFIDALKQLRFRDDAGKFWMIGARTAKWYCFDYHKNDWVQSEPPSLGKHRAICIYCGFENDLEAEFCARCGNVPREDEGTKAGLVCPRCGTRLEAPDASCPVCLTPSSVLQDVPQDAVPRAAGDEALASGGQAESLFVVRSVRAISFFWFCGGLGVFAGILAGLLVGVTGFFPGFVARLPDFLTSIQGTLQGGIVFPLFGAVLGFACLGGAGFILAELSNVVLSLVGGLRFQAGRTSPGPKP